ncbi:DUF1127 domain-containing protein [Plasticicumulans acidivorans]|uniref:Uncharacterized protein YjiS (DUF1127 family) n=1 Tax=Plasticicumulans acidivorans TaxID=886464 RepID=A0A317MRJ0_9GAMM|nr:DUF1127 domain-containing protein [Plasticicumulans acidivorans]PWV58908.1 uncharacterized protein YjiS (DUF1127 family) [Plasticicumulans acidivorans]
MIYEEVLPQTSALARVPGISQRIYRALRRGVATAVRWFHRYQQRRALLYLDAHLLKDIGVSRSEALEEGCKPFWRD